MCPLEGQNERRLCHGVEMDLLHRENRLNIGGQRKSNCCSLSLHEPEPEPDRHSLPECQCNEPGVVLQQDNARHHVANVEITHFQHNNTDVLPWPAASPDIAPI